MIFFAGEQGTPEWKNIRAGVPTASNFDKILTAKGEPSTQRQKYLYQLVGERLTGKPMETYTNGNMERGKELEAEARQAYELLTDVTVEQVGFCLEEGRRYGCSPDGLIGEDGGLEIKCPTLPVAIEYLDKGKLPAEYYQQVQGCLFVTKRKWWDFFSYYPGLPPFMLRVMPDVTFLTKLDIELVSFSKSLLQTTKKFQGKGGQNENHDLKQNPRA